jgi:sphingolipid delta-4 desaturase
MLFEITTLGGILVAIVAIAFAERSLSRSGSPHHLGRTRAVDRDPSLRIGERVWAWQDREFLRATLVDLDVESADSTSTGPVAPMCRVIFDHAPTDEVYMPASMIRADSEEPPEMVPAHEWHTRRRRMILSTHPEIRNLTSLPADFYFMLTSALLLLHLGVGATIAVYAHTSTAWFWTIVLAATIGAFFTFVLQQLAHELSHVKRSWQQMMPALLTDVIFGSTGPGFAIYYFKFHIPHHAKTGDEGDPDLTYHAEWADPPRWLARSRLTRFIWLTVFGLFTIEVFFLERWLGLVPRPRMSIRNKRFMLMLLGKYSFMALTLWLGGLWCFVYFRLAAGFSLGAFAHPYGGFWLMQHAATVRNGFQPTVSYSGSRIWHWLNLGELYHLEHHDFPWVPFTKIEAVRRIAPEYYRSCHVVTSVWRLTWDWLCHTDGSPWSDVAGVLVYPLPAPKERIRRRPTPPFMMPIEAQTDNPDFQGRDEIVNST